MSDVRSLTFDAADHRHAAHVVDLLAPVVPVLAEALGPQTEAVLHDLTRFPNTIAAIGGTITGRSIGGPPTDLGLRVFARGHNEHLVGYMTRNVDGTPMRSSSIFFNTDAGKPVVCLCINTDVGELTRARQILEAMTTAGGGSVVDSGLSVDSESFPSTIDSLAEGILTDAIADVGVPMELMRKDHKVSVVGDLHARGFFGLRESVEMAAERLDVSRHTIYNYLKELADDG